MTPAELKRQVIATETGKYFFSPDTMRFFDQRMSEFKVRQGWVIKDRVPMPVWVLTWTLHPWREHNWKGVDKTDTYYFKADDYGRVFPSPEDTVVVQPHRRPPVVN